MNEWPTWTCDLHVHWAASSRTLFSLTIQWSLAPAVALLPPFIYETLSRKKSELSFLNQQIAWSNKPPSLACSLSVFAGNNEAHVSQEDDRLTRLSIVKPEDPPDVFFLPYYSIYEAHWFSHMTSFFTKWPEEVHCGNGLNMNEGKYPTIHMYTRPFSAISETEFLILSLAWTSVLYFCRNVAHVESTEDHPYSKRCEKFRLFVPAAGFGTMLFAVIAPAHIAPIYDRVECGSCSLPLLMLIETVHNVWTHSFRKSFFTLLFPILQFDSSCSNAAHLVLGVFGEINSWLHILRK